MIEASLINILPYFLIFNMSELLLSAPTPLKIHRMLLPT